MRLKSFLLAALAVGVLQGEGLRSHPYIQNVSRDRAVILWTLSGNDAPGFVQFGTGTTLDRVAISTVRPYPPEETGLAQIMYQHRAELTGLLQGERYRYRVLVSGATEEGTFETSSPSKPFDFLVFGDSGTGGDAQHSLARRMEQENAVFALHLGDLAYQDGTFQQLEDLYLTPYRALMRRMAFFPVPGNHDYHTRDGAPYLAIHDVPTLGVPSAGRGRYYSFDWGNVHLAILDSNRPLIDALDGSGEMLRWLERDLSATRQELRVVAFHHPPFPTANYRGDAHCLRVQTALAPILERHGVHLVLTGHEHLYQRNRPRRGEFRTGIGTLYVTSGGGGSIVYPPGEDDFIAKGAGVSHYLRIRARPHRLIVQAIGLDGETFDEFEVSSAPRIEPGGVRDAARGGSIIAPGGLASVYGSDLALGDASASALPLPSSLDGVTVSVGGWAARLLFVSRNQLNFQVPSATASGERQVHIQTSGGSQSIPATVRPVAPAIFVAGHPSGTLVGPNAPAVPGTMVTLFLTGLGATVVPVSDGSAPGPVPVQVIEPVRVELGGLTCEITFAGLAPGFVGLNQVNFRVPRDAPDGTASLLVISNGIASQPITIAIKR
jgi:uncharacterized protein (TIGR03437 family)